MWTITHPPEEKKRTCIKGDTGPRLVLSSVECIEVMVDEITLVGRKVGDPTTANVVRTTGGGRLTMHQGVHTLHLMVDDKPMKFCIPHAICILWYAE